MSTVVTILGIAGGMLVVLFVLIALICIGAIMFFSENDEELSSTDLNL